MSKDNLRLVSSNNLARQISLQLNPEEPYTTPVTTVVLRVDNPFDTKKNGVVKYVNTFDPNHPEWLVIPTASQIGDGKVFLIDSNKLGITGYDESYLSFRDGVLNLNLYVGLQTVSVTGDKDTNWLIGTGLETLLQNYDSVIIGSETYELRKDLPTNGGTVVYLDRYLEEDVTSVTFAERNNLKVFNDFKSKCIIAKSSALLGTDLYPNRTSDKEQAVLKVIRNKMAASILFEQEDYKGAERLLLENIEIGNHLRVLKGGQLWI